MSKIAFYAPIKPPDHPIPSGDRLVAQNLIKALTLAGYDVELASKFIAYSKREGDEILRKKKADALVEAEAVVERLKDNPPDLWLTYHPYCKAPDWIGPHVSQALNIPYVTVEAAKTGQGFEDGGDRWAKWRTEAQQQMRGADLHLAFKPTDREYLTELLGGDEKISNIPPFIDATPPAQLPQISYPAHWRPSVPVMVTASMMRPGKKLKNFEILAKALEPIKALHWNLVIIGDGPEEENVKSLFASFDPDRIWFTGRLSHDAVLAQMAKADLFVWPGWQEPIGMVYLEAQMMGLPVAALNSMGTPLTNYHGETGLLAPQEDIPAYSENLHTLLSHPSLRADFGNAAQTSVQNRHSLQAAAKALKNSIEPLLTSAANAS